MPTADIVIIGGGIIGTSIAYQLAMRGAKNVVLLEGETLAFGSSGRATGGIRQQSADELDIRFSVEGVRFYEHFTQQHDRAIARPPFYQHVSLQQTLLISAEGNKVCSNRRMGAPKKADWREERRKRTPSR